MPKYQREGKWVLSHSKHSAAVGLSPFTSTAKLWRQLKEIEPPEISSPYMQYGIENEHRAVAAVEAATGLMFDDTGGSQVRKELEFVWGIITGKPDGQSGTKGLEVKCPQKLKDEVPKHYQVQLVSQFMLCGFTEIYYGEWSPRETRVWYVHRNTEFEQVLLAELEKFVTLLHGDKPPERWSKKKNPKPVFPTLETERIA